MTKTQQTAAKLAEKLAHALNLPFKHATTEEILGAGETDSHLLFRVNTDGTVTVASCGYLPSLWRVKPGFAIRSMEPWLEGIVAARMRDANQGRGLSPAFRSQIVPQGVSLVSMSDTQGVADAIKDAVGE
jgi:hypothetical protein